MQSSRPWVKLALPCDEVGFPCEAGMWGWAMLFANALDAIASALGWHGNRDQFPGSSGQCVSPFSHFFWQFGLEGNVGLPRFLLEPAPL